MVFFLSKATGEWPNKDLILTFRFLIPIEVTDREVKNGPLDS